MKRLLFAIPPVAMAVGVLLAPHASASPRLVDVNGNDAIVANAAYVCMTEDRYFVGVPTSDLAILTSMGKDFMATGWSPSNAVDIIVGATSSYCSRNMLNLVAAINAIPDRQQPMHRMV